MTQLESPARSNSIYYWPTLRYQEYSTIIVGISVSWTSVTTRYVLAGTNYVFPNGPPRSGGAEPYIAPCHRDHAGVALRNEYNQRHGDTKELSISRQWRQAESERLLIQKQKKTYLIRPTSHPLTLIQIKSSWVGGGAGVADPLTYCRRHFGQTPASTTHVSFQSLTSAMRCNEAYLSLSSLLLPCCCFLREGRAGLPRESATFTREPNRHQPGGGGSSNRLLKITRHKRGYY